VAVRIRMKQMGRKHRHYYRIVAIDGRQARDGRIIEELGSYDPMVRDTDQNVTLKPARIKYWLGVGARPSEKVAILLKKYMTKWEQREAEQQAGAASGGQPQPPTEAAAEPAAETPPA
jgi:small subunit ribosomal protein S16